MVQLVANSLEVFLRLQRRQPTFPVNSSPGAGHCVRVRTVPIVAPTLGGARRFSQTEQPPNRQRNQGQRTGIG
ncbi:unnamed protein product [Gadus morhua 'NCC']